MNLVDDSRALRAALALHCRVHCSAAHLFAPGAGFLVGIAAMLSSPAVHAEGSAVLTGVVTDASSHRPLKDVVVAVTSPALQGEQTVVTDGAGSYRIPNLPPGSYTLTVEGDAFKPYSRAGIALRVDSTILVNVELLPVGIKAEEVVVVGKAPTVDVGATSTGVTLNQDFIGRIALNPPGNKFAASRSFESLAATAPGAQLDTYGVSVAGTTSPENGFRIDGVTVNNPAFGILGTPLSVEFIKEIGVITGGYLPEYGKSIGGVFDVVTKTGSNSFHGSVFVNYTPGALEGPRKIIKSAASTITTNPSLSSLRDFGADLGGPILKDKLWFYVGALVSFNQQKLERNLSAFLYTPDPNHAGSQLPTIGSDGFPSTHPLTCPAGQACSAGTPTSPIYQATERTIQYIGKLTYLINRDHSLTLSAYGTPTRSGGSGQISFDATDRPFPISAYNGLPGTYNSLGGQNISDSNDLSLKYAGAFNNKHQLVDVTLGWHHQHQATLSADGSGPADVGTPGTLANVPQVFYRKTDPVPHSITDFERIPGAGAFCRTVTVWTSTTTGCSSNADCTQSGFATTCNMSTHVCEGPKPTSTCPVDTYYTGGRGYLEDVNLNSYQARAVVTDLLSLAGHHVLKAGIDFSYDVYRHDKAYSGGDLYREGTDGSSYADFRNYGFLSGPDQEVPLSHYVAKTSTIGIGGFLQDSWQILDKMTLNVGVRYDAQILYGADGGLGLTLPNQWSPRIGIIYDFTHQGRSKIFAHYARYYEGIPLDMADRAFPVEPQVSASHASPPCDPSKAADVAPGGSCTTNQNRQVQGNATNPSQLWAHVGGSKAAVDPHIDPQSSDELVIGGEYEVIPDARVGISFTHRYLNKAIEDMSRDEGNTFFIGNPGYGIAGDFPKATRNYDAMTVYFQKTYSSTWLFLASYTLSRLYGNFSGLFKPETAQLNPNTTTDFDLRSLLPNRTGLLPLDSTHQFKFYAAKDFVLPQGHDILIGLTYTSRTGAPRDVLGSHLLYGAKEVYILPRGSGGTLNPDFTINPGREDWIHDVDLRVGYSVKLNKETTLGITVDIFNLFNFQAATLRDSQYTASDVFPCPQGGDIRTCIRHSDGNMLSTPFNAKTEVNPNYGKPVAYQDPTQVRFGAKVTF